MRVAIVGGGPAGLYLALLLRRRRPDVQVRVVEQNPPEIADGWGLVFSRRALAFLREADPASHADLARSLLRWDDQVIVHRDRRVVIDGIGFAGIARARLLAVLRAHAAEAGADLTFGRRVDDVAALGDADLLVGADGVRSVVRETFGGVFQSTVTLLGNRYAWFGTRQPFPALTLTFRDHDGEAFVAHHYPYGGGPDGEPLSTFIVECDAATWERSGLSAMGDEARRRHCERVFAAGLGGHPLLQGRGTWSRFPVVTTARWTHEGVALLGDALRTVHFSIGSGTRTALEDARALADALAVTDDVPAALRAFERARRPEAEAFLDVAARSWAWYEGFPRLLGLDPVAFAYAYVTRGGRIDPARLAARSPRFAEAVAAAGIAAGGEPA